MYVGVQADHLDWEQDKLEVDLNGDAHDYWKTNFERSSSSEESDNNSPNGSINSNVSRNSQRRRWKKKKKNTDQNIIEGSYEK